MKVSALLPNVLLAPTGCGFAQKGGTHRAKLGGGPEPSNFKAGANYVVL
jgi:hypothetical protein